MASTITTTIENPCEHILRFTPLLGASKDLKFRTGQNQVRSITLAQDRYPWPRSINALQNAAPAASRITLVVDNADTKLAAIEAGADVRDGDRQLLVALLLQRADVISRTDL